MCSDEVAHRVEAVPPPGLEPVRIGAQGLEPGDEPGLWGGEVARLHIVIEAVEQLYPVVPAKSWVAGFVDGFEAMLEISNVL